MLLNNIQSVLLFRGAFSVNLMYGNPDLKVFFMTFGNFAPFAHLAELKFLLHTWNVEEFGGDENWIDSKLDQTRYIEQYKIFAQKAFL
jgi:hypothetical protein